MRKLAFFLLSLGISLSANAQMGTDENTNDQYLTNTRITFKPEEVHYVGSAYENEDFVKGNVFKNGKVIANQVGIRYNALRDEMEIKTDISQSNTSARIMIKSPDIYVRILNKMFVYSPQKEGIDKGGYFISLFEGDKAHLYKKITKEFVAGMEATTSITRDIPDSYKERETYYLFDKNLGVFHEFPNSKGGKLSLFKDQKKAVKEYTKKEKLNLNKEYALIKLVRFYNTL
ncbi:MAG: hypothetical protein R2793_09460 [Flavobacteriaceae bacterium]